MTRQGMAGWVSVLTLTLCRSGLSAAELGDLNGDFVRADSDGNGKVEVTDPIFTLNALFLGGDIWHCADAADSDDDGQVNISDLVYPLQYLFLGGAKPPPPYPDRGEDPTQDGLGCGGI